MADTQAITDPEKLDEKQVQELLDYLAELVKQHHQLRLANDAVAFGAAKGKVPPEKAREVIKKERDKAKEAEAIAELKKLYAALNLEIKNGPDELKKKEDGGGMGVFPVLAIAAIAGGALTLTSLFTYLTEREQRIQTEVTGQSGGFLDNLLTGQTGTLVKVGGLGLLAYFGWKWWQEREGKGLRNPDDLARVDEELLHKAVARARELMKRPRAAGGLPLELAAAQAAHETSELLDPWAVEQELRKG